MTKPDPGPGIGSSFPGTWSWDTERLNLSKSSRVRATTSHSRTRTLVLKKQKLHESRGGSRLQKEVRGCTARKTKTDRERHKNTQKSGTEERETRDRQGDAERRAQRREEGGDAREEAVSRRPGCARGSLRSRLAAPRRGERLTDALASGRDTPSHFCSFTFPRPCYQLPPRLSPLCTQWEFNHQC